MSRQKGEGDAAAVCRSAGVAGEDAERCQAFRGEVLRVYAYSPDRLPPFGRPELRRLWQLATDHGLLVQLHFVPRYAAGFEPLIREFPRRRSLSIIWAGRFRGRQRARGRTGLGAV